METKDRRWYDSHLETSRTIKLLEKLSEEEKEALSQSLITIVNQIKDFHRDDYDDETKEPQLSLRLNRIMRLYK